MRRPPLALLLLGFTACGEDLTTFSEVVPLRILAVGADKPWLAPGDSAELSALIATDEPPTYEWSWCPFAAGSDQGFECAVSRELLQAQLDEQLGDGLVVIPPYELGTSTTATFNFSFVDNLSPQFRQGFFDGLCGAFSMGEVPSFVSLPDCSNGTYPITVRMVVTTSEEVEVAIKELELAFEERAINNLNQNPRIDDAFWALSLDPTRTSSLSAEGETMLQYNTESEPTLDIPEDVAESFTFINIDEVEETRLENLVVTWLSDAGELEFTRTSFLENEIPFERTRRNVWTSPKEVDYPEATANLYFVLRDGRGGTTWQTRQVRFKEGP